MLERESFPVGSSVKNASHHQRDVQLSLSLSHIYSQITLHQLSRDHRMRVNRSRDCEIHEIPGHAESWTCVDTNREEMHYGFHRDVSYHGSNHLPLPRGKLLPNAEDSIRQPATGSLHSKKFRLTLLSGSTIPAQQSIQCNRNNLVLLVYSTHPRSPEIYLRHANPRERRHNRMLSNAPGQLTPMPHTCRYFPLDP